MMPYPWLAGLPMRMIWHLMIMLLMVIQMVLMLLMMIQMMLMMINQIADGDNALIFCWWWGWSDRWTHCNVHFVDDTVWRWSRNGWSFFMAVTFTLNIDHFRVKQKYFQFSAIEKLLAGSKFCFHYKGYLCLCYFVTQCETQWLVRIIKKMAELGFVTTFSPTM